MYKNYHAQVYDGFEHWPEFIDRALPKLQRIHAGLTQYAFTPAVHVQSFIDKGAIRLELESTFEELLRTHSNAIRLQTPQLHIFHDMTEFTHWDASNNPFLIDEMKPSFR